MSKRDWRSSNAGGGGSSSSRAWSALRQSVAEALRCAGAARVAYADVADADAAAVAAATASAATPIKTEEQAAPAPADVEAHGSADAAPMDVDGADATLVPPPAASSSSSAAGTRNVTIGPSPLALFTRATEAFIHKLCLETKRFAESANRTAANEIDVACAYIRTGHDVRQLLSYASAYREAYAQASASGASMIVRPDPNEVESYVLPVPQSVPTLLRDAKLQKRRPAHIPKHMPEFPDLHTFVRTPVFEPVEARYVEWRREKTRLNGHAKASLARIAFGLHHGHHPKIKTFGPDLKLDPVYVQPNPKRSRFQHLLVATNCVLIEDHGPMETLDRSAIQYENDTEAQAANTARIFAKVELREPM